VELPAAMTAVDAKDLIAHTAKRVKWARETLAWRSVELDPAVGPGAVVRVPGQAGRWRVQDWEWREAGVELSLERMAPVAMSLGQAVSSGQANVAADLLATPTRIMAFELPWDGVGSSDSVGIYAALSSVGAGWSGAELFVESGDGALHPIGVSGRERSTMGVLASGLPVASPMMIDRSSAFTVQLVAAEMSLANATLRQLAAGANRALIGEEIIQFGRAEALGNGLWRLSQLLRGRGGSEQAIVSHDSGVGFVLLDNIPVALDAAMIGSASDVKIAAMGLGDQIAVDSVIYGRGVGLRPLMPVHPRLVRASDGAIVLSWTRRARGAWLWNDGADAPLVEQSEQYEVIYGDVAAPLARWVVEVTKLELTASVVSNLQAGLMNGGFYVRQQGTYAVSTPTYIGQI
jgi:Putative phage tail protein